MVIDLRRQAETLKDTLRVEDRNFAYNVEKIKDLNKKRVEGDVIDTVFDKIYDSLSLLQAEIKSKNKPDVYESELMDQLLQRAEKDNKIIKGYVKDK